jgi:hypothetical protein
VGIHTGSAPVILETIGSLLAAAIGASIGWVSLEFVARPIRKFFDLRGEIIRRVAQYNNVPARYREGPDGQKNVVEIDANEFAKLSEAQSVIRDLAAQMRGFAYNETFARRVLSPRYNPRLASEGLFGLSNDIDTYGNARVRHRKTISDALRIPNL